ncbi:hypothetical protein NJ76_10960 [Rhodococcus sp. IITR03]|nr:hypothetical protein NJ76_10960 [Rhodococcus sp. IITR03]
MSVRGLLYRLYERRLLKELDGARHPRHVAVMCDGNRRWARENGFTDVSHGHREGAKKIAELLSWCDAAGIETATIYLLSTENLRRDPEELDALLEIISDVVEEISAPGQNWGVKIVGTTDLLPADHAKRLHEAAPALRAGRARTSTWPSGTAVARRSSTRCSRFCGCATRRGCVARSSSSR